MADGLLIKQEKYLETGIHIGTKLRTIDMGRFIYRTRSDGLYVLDLRKVDERIRLAGKVLSKAEPSDIVVIASRTYSSLAAKAFATITGCRVVDGRFVPGMFTNVSRDDFSEPKLVLICDPKGERQAVVECGKMGVSTVGLCDTDNFTSFIDWVVPCNNKGRRSLSLIFWLFAREMAMGSKKISSYEEFKPTFEEFEALTNVEEGAPKEGEAAAAEAVAGAQEGAVSEESPADAEAKEAAGEEGKEKKAKPKAEKKKAEKAQEKKAEKPKEKEEEKKHEAKEEKTGEEKHEHAKEKEGHAHEKHD